MKCASEFQELANHNPFVQDLVEQGYHIDFINGYVVIYGIPYLDKDGALEHGDWFSPVDLNDWVIDPPRSHQVWFHGGVPHYQNGTPLPLGSRADSVKITEDLVSDHSFSYKLMDDAGQKRPYHSFEEKTTTYLDAITGPAINAYPDATPHRAIEIEASAQGSPLCYPDTLSSRYNINDISSLLRDKKVAIIGLGGTGAYILDFLSRTHLENITLFDDDKVHVHTIFRIPGFIPQAIGKTKVEALAQQYGNWHKGITPIPERVTIENIERLSEFDFVFVSVDDGQSRRDTVDWLSTHDIPFVDCGMGLNRSLEGLFGAVRITGVDRAAFEQTVNTRHLPTTKAKEDEYRKQAQIAELNALNAALAVLRFKQHFKLYECEGGTISHIFETASFELDEKRHSN